MILSCGQGFGIGLIKQAAGMLDPTGWRQAGEGAHVYMHSVTCCCCLHKVPCPWEHPPSLGGEGGE